MGGQLSYRRNRTPCCSVRSRRRNRMSPMAACAANPSFPITSPSPRRRLIRGPRKSSPLSLTTIRRMPPANRVYCARCAVSPARSRSIRMTVWSCETMRDRMNVYFPPELLKQIADLADRKKLSRSAIVEAAVASFLSPDGEDRREAAFARRLDRLSRQVQRLERDLGVTAETLALFVRFWLTITPPLPNDAQAAAQIKGRERFEGFIETLGRRLQKGQNFLREIPEDIVRQEKLGET